MRPWISLIAVVAIATGCNHVALERRTVKQASTLSDLQYRQVLDNLAMFCCNNEALAWHLKLKGGLVQVADQGTGSFGADIATATGGEVTRLFPSASGQRGILGQWDVDPTVDPGELELLRLAYVKALCPDKGDLVGLIDDKICELSVQFDVLPTNSTMKRIFESKNVKDRIEDQLKLISTKLQGIKDQAYTLTQGKPERIKILEKEWESAPPAQKQQLEIEISLLRAELEFVKGKDGNTDEKKPAALAGGYFASLHKELLQRKLDYQETLATVLNVLEPTKGQAAPALYQASPSLASRGFPGLGAPGPFGGLGAAGRPNTRLLSFLFGSDEPTPLGVRDQLLLALQLASDSSTVPPTEMREASQRNVGLVAQAEEKIVRLQALLDDPKFQQRWVHCGCKKDVPKCACLVGCYCHCGQECCVWVDPEHLDVLREFTLVVLSLAPNESQEMFPRGAGYSPALVR